MTTEKSKLKKKVVNFENEIRCGTNAAHTILNINDVSEPVTPSECMMHFWFDRFHFGNFDLNNEPCSRSETIVNNDEAKTIVVAHHLKPRLN